MVPTTNSNPVLAAYERMRRGLKQMATRMMGDEEDAEDALQDAFVRLWVRRKDIDNTEQAAALMTTTVKNLSIDTLRRRQTASAVPLDEEHDGPPDDEAALQEEADERFREVQTLIAQELSLTQQTILRMRDYEDRSYDEIASFLNMQPTAVRMQLSRARKTVRDAYRAQHATKSSSQ